MQHILNAPDLEDDSYTRTLKLGLLSKVEKKVIILNQFAKFKKVAAIEIQRFWRGYWVRKQLRGIVEKLAASEDISTYKSTIQETLRAKRYVPSHITLLTKSQLILHTKSPPKNKLKELQQRIQRTITRVVKYQAKLRPELAESRKLSAASRKWDKLIDSALEVTATITPSSSHSDKFKEAKTCQASFQHPKGKIIKTGTSQQLYQQSSGKIEDKTSSSEFIYSFIEKQISSELTMKSTAGLALEDAYGRYVWESFQKGQSSAEVMQFRDYCAHKIQVKWLLRHHSFLKARFIRHLEELSSKAAVVVASETLFPEDILEEEEEKTIVLTEGEAAVKIQKAWRRHIDKQVYVYYHDLISFKNRGDPSAMLRCINPNEAKLLDAASGATVKFRLAGEQFPPSIYYKIFTHRPIQDLGANSPKDYTQPEAKQLAAREKHNKVTPLPQKKDLEQHKKEYWYKRFENNGWRLVSDRMIHHNLLDPVTWDTSRKLYYFDHSKLKRRQEVEKQKKLRKIHWMRKMYKEGMLQAKVDDRETAHLIEGAAAGMIATMERQGPEALEDWEVNELLEWTTALNFDEYFKSWKQLGTSEVSENIIEKRTPLGISRISPYELTVSTATSHCQPSRQSQHAHATIGSDS